MEKNNDVIVIGGESTEENNITEIATNENTSNDNNLIREYNDIWIDGISDPYKGIETYHGVKKDSVATPYSQTNNVEDDYNDLKLLQNMSKIDDLKAIRDNIKDQQKNMQLTVDDGFIDEYLKDISVDELKKMSSDEINKFFIDKDGEELEINEGVLKQFKNQDEINTFKKDLLIFRKETDVYIDNLDTEIKNMEISNKEFSNRYDEIIAEYDSVQNYVRNLLVKKLETADTDEKKNLIQRMIDAYDDAITLDRLKRYCKSYKGKSILSDYLNDKRAHYINRRYHRVATVLKLHGELTNFVDIEKYLPAEYMKRTNIFVFSLIHYISSLHNKNYDKVDGVFITQVMVNLRNLIFDRFLSDNSKQQFINSICEVLKIIG